MPQKMSDSMEAGGRGPSLRATQGSHFFVQRTSCVTFDIPTEFSPDERTDFSVKTFGTCHRCRSALAREAHCTFHSRKELPVLPAFVPRGRQVVMGIGLLRSLQVFRSLRFSLPFLDGAGLACIDHRHSDQCRGTAGERESSGRLPQPQPCNEARKNR